MLHYFIINPHAGCVDSTASMAREISKVFNNLNLEYYIYITTGTEKDDLFLKRVCDLEKEVRFYSCGGDGTIHTIINAVYSYPHASISVIPCGTGNDYIKSIGGYIDLATLLSDGEEVLGDLIRVNKRLCLNITSIGLDADITATSLKYKKKPILKYQAYTISLLECVMGRLGREISISIDNEPPILKNILIACFAKGRYYGKRFCAAPRASVVDGFIDICIIEKIPRTKLIKLIPTYQKGNHLDNPMCESFVVYKKVKCATLQSNLPFAINLDGEVFHANHVSFSVIPKAFRLYSMPFSVPVHNSTMDNMMEKETVSVSSI